MEREKFRKLVLEAIESLPSQFKENMKNIDVVVEDSPKANFIKHYHLSQSLLLLGLYQGVPLTKRGVNYGNVLPDKITIFQEPIERICHSEEEIKKTVVDVVTHEVGHYFGLSERDLSEIKGGKEC